MLYGEQFTVWVGVCVFGRVGWAECSLGFCFARIGCYVVMKHMILLLLTLM